MKKFFVLIATIFSIATVANAQEYYDQQRLDSLEQELDYLKQERIDELQAQRLKAIWGRTKFFDVNYVWSNLKDDWKAEKKSNYGVALNLGNTYYLHKKPLLGMIKIGLDAIWMDLTYANYEKGNFHLPSLNPDDYYNEDNGYDYDGDMEFGSLGWHKIDIGLGFGPSVSIAPFTSFDNALKDLKAQLYFHFTPSFTALLSSSDEDDIEFHGGFSPIFNFGGDITWKMIGLGIEGRWCSAKFSNFTDSDAGSDKYKTSDCRLFIRLCF